MFLFEKTDKNVQFNSWNFCVRVRQGAFLSRFRFEAAKKNVWEIAMKKQIKQREETKIKRLGFLKQI